MNEELTAVNGILIGLIMILSGIIYFLFNNRKKLLNTLAEMNQALVSTTRLDFNNDLTALRFLISYKVRVLDNQIKLSKIGNRAYLFKFNEEKDRIVTEVYMEISPIYKSVLEKYFTDQGLMIFISYSVYMELVEIFRKNNLGTPTTESDWINQAPNPEYGF